MNRNSQPIESSVIAENLLYTFTCFVVFVCDNSTYVCPINSNDVLLGRK